MTELGKPALGSRSFEAEQLHTDSIYRRQWVADTIDKLYAVLH